MTRMVSSETVTITLLGVILTLQSCSNDITSNDITKAYINLINGEKLTFNKDGTGSDVGITGDRFNVKYRVEGDKVFLQEYRDSSPTFITNITLAKQSNERLCIVEPKYPMPVCYAKEK